MKKTNKKINKKNLNHYINRKEADDFENPDRKEFVCYNCGKKFNEPLERYETQARLFGLDELLTDEVNLVKLCPFCKSDEILVNYED